MAQTDTEVHERNRTGRFYREVMAERRKVTWPTRAELYGATIVVSVVTAGLACALGIVDAIFTKLIEFIF